MEKIIDHISLDLLEAELTPERMFCRTNKGGNLIYIVDAHNAPNVMQEIGRLREIAFREAGGSSGLAADIDSFDTMERPYRQIVVWDPDARAILGGYRYILGPDVALDSDGQPKLATAHMFHFSDFFIKEYLPHTMELGRSFVAPEYQSSKAGAKGLYALDNLWDAIAAVAGEHPGIIYLFGKMTTYPSYDHLCQDLIFHFLWKHFPDPEELVRPYKPVMPESNPRLMDLLLRDADFKSDYRNLKDAVRRLGANIPPLVNSYMQCSPSMKMMGSAVNDEFSDVIETAIMICINEMYPEKLDRHRHPSFGSMVERIKGRFPRISDESLQRIKDRRDSRKTAIFEKLKDKLNPGK